jgi:hypothetical protein
MNLKGVCGGLACVFLWACGSGGGSGSSRDAGALDAAAGAAGESEAGDGNTDSSAAGADDSAPPGVTVPIDPGGGELTLSGVTVTVPEDAVSTPTDLTLRRIGSNVLGYHLYSDLFELSPIGTVFSKPVQISIPYSGDSTLANTFATSSVDPSYAWVATTTTDSVATATIDSAGRFFVANGTDYVEQPTPDCTRVDVIDGVFASSRALNLLVSATDCQGRPLAPQKETDFTALEDGEPLADSPVSLRDPPPLAPFLTVLVDLNALAAAASETQAAVSAALTSLKNPALRVGVSLYGGADTVTELLAPTLDAKAISTAVEQLGTYKLPSKLSAASFAATAAAVTELDGLRTAFKSRNAGGALADGFVIWITAADSKEATAVQATALSTITDSGDRIITVSLADTSAVARQ